VAHVVVALDVAEIDGLGDARDLVDVAGVGPEVAVIDDAPDVALEMTMVDGIEPDERGEQPDIGFGEAFPAQEA